MYVQYNGVESLPACQLLGNLCVLQHYDLSTTVCMYVCMYVCTNGMYVCMMIDQGLTYLPTYIQVCQAYNDIRYNRAGHINNEVRLNPSPTYLLTYLPTYQGWMVSHPTYLQ